jgi:hypothetical protein
MSAWTSTVPWLIADARAAPSGQEPAGTGDEPAAAERHRFAVVFMPAFNRHGQPQGFKAHEASFRRTVSVIEVATHVIYEGQWSVRGIMSGDG